MRINKREFAFKQEVTPGTAEALTSAEVLIRIEDSSTVEPDIEVIETNEVQASSSRRPNLTGRKILGIPINYILRGPNSLANAPAANRLFECAMLLATALKRVPIGAITTGPFQDGESFTAAPSAATGRVFRSTANGATELKYFVLTGIVADNDVLTGAVSGATVTVSDPPTDYGRVYRFVDSDFGALDTRHHITAQYLLDGYQWTARGVLGDMTMNFRNGHPCRISQRLIGAFESHSDLALYGVSTYPEQSVAAPRFLGAELYLGSYKPTDIVEFSLELQTGAEAREDANSSSADGVLYADYQRAAPVARFDPAFVKAATKDWFGDLVAGSTFAMRWKLGSAAGMIWEFFADQAQLNTVGVGARGNLATAPLEIRLCGTNNDELFIWQH